MYDIPSNATRGGHSHRQQTEFLIAISGSFDVILQNGTETQKVTLNKLDKGLLIPINTCRELKNFSSGAVCLILASAVFNEED